MRVLTVYAHPDPRSFCHAVLDDFTAGLHEAGHAVEVVDLSAIGFDPVFRQRDMATYLHEDIPPDVLAGMNLQQRFIRQHAPRDAREQWHKVAAADGLAFIAPVFWLHFPAILKGWFERVFAYGSAYALSRELGWEFAHAG